jgi:hypothetical protein
VLKGDFEDASSIALFGCESIDPSPRSLSILDCCLLVETGVNDVYFADNKYSMGKATVSQKSSSSATASCIISNEIFMNLWVVQSPLISSVYMVC